MAKKVRAGTGASGTRRKRGRPAGAKTGNYEAAETVATQCPKCGSSNRTPYFGTVEREIDGMKDGQTFTHVVWRRTKCVDCGQLRQDRTYENRPD